MININIKDNIYLKDNSYNFNVLLNIIEKNPIHFSQIILKHYQFLLDWINIKLPQLNSKQYLLKTKCYWILNNLTDFPKCINPECNNILIEKNIKNMNFGYNKHCCQQCAKNSSIRKQKYQKTCEIKYGKGIINASQAIEVKDKKIKSYFKKYNVNNPSKCEKIKSKIKQTNIKRYGVTCSLNSQIAKEKSIQTCLKRYNQTSFSKTSLFIDKIKKSNLLRFGVEFPNQCPEFRKNTQKKYKYNEILFDSSYEIALFIYCIDNNIECIPQPNIKFEYYFNNEKHFYNPDFMINGRYVEVKGLQFFKDKNINNQMINPYDQSQNGLYEAKHQCMLKNNILILTDMNKYIKYINFKYGKSYLKQFKNI